MYFALNCFWLVSLLSQFKKCILAYFGNDEVLVIYVSDYSL